MKITVTFLLLLSINALAEDLNCPPGTQQEPPPFTRPKQYDVYCFKLEAGKKIKHGPYWGFENPNFGEVGSTHVVSLKGQFENDRPVGLWKGVGPDGKIKYQNEFNDQMKIHGKFQSFHGNGAVRVEGVFENDNPKGSFKLFDSAGKLLKDGPYSEIEAANKALKEQEAKTAEAQKKAETEAAVKKRREFEEQLQKQWTKKVKGETTLLSDMQTKQTWTAFLGTANWFNAKTKCLKLSMKLPSFKQLQQGIENGLLHFINNPYGVLWSDSDKTNVNDPELSMMLDNKSAFAITADGQLIPEKKISDIGVICVK